MKERVRYYRDFDTDFSVSKNQSFALPHDYVYVRRDKLFRLLSALSYGAAYVFAQVYCRLFLKMRIRGKKIPRTAGGAFIFANHTQPVGDVFMPALASRARIYTVVSPANYGIPVIGKWLKYLGALPVPKEIKRLRQMSLAVEERLRDGANIVIYPEGHVWEYYNGVRPFGTTPFYYPVKYGKPLFVLTTIYKKARFGKKPRLHLYVDGPIRPGENLTPREASEELRLAVRRIMESRCAEGDAEYIKYIKEEKNDKG